MKLKKIKKILTINLPIICGFSIALPLVLSTTSCSKQNEWTFTNLKEVNKYLLEHKVSLSNKHEFAPLRDCSDPEGKQKFSDEQKRTFFEKDYHFIADNMNLQLLVNSCIENFATIHYWDNINLNLKKINNTYTISYTSYKGELKETYQSIIEYNDKIINIQNDDSSPENVDYDDYVFDFNKDFLFELGPDSNASVYHYVKYVLQVDKDKRKNFSLNFNDTSNTRSNFSLRLSPFDWSNDKISWVPSYDSSGK